jgi:hypothetical protein
MLRCLWMLGALVVFALFAPHPAIAQTPATPPQPGPEHKRLEFFVGTWNIEGEMPPSSFGAGGKYTAVQTCEWFEGRFHVLCRSDVKSPDGNEKELEVLGYSASEGTYTRYNIGSSGNGAFATGKLNGKTWDWRGDAKVQGKITQFHFPWTEISDDSYTFTVESSAKGSPTTILAKGKAVRVK